MASAEGAEELRHPLGGRGKGGEGSMRSSRRPQTLRHRIGSGFHLGPKLSGLCSDLCTHLQ